MNITLYRNHSDSKTLNKVIDSNTVVYDVQLFEPTDILNPVLTMNAFTGDPSVEGSFSIQDYNYLYIPLFHRYYFFKVRLENHKAVLTCTVDPLMSHKNEIAQINTMISRNEYTFNPNIPDERLPINPRKFITSKNVGSPLGDKCYLLLVKG